MTIHEEPHPQSGQTVTLTTGSEYRIEDWWDRVAGQSWMFAQGNPACIQYAIRSGVAGLPTDDEVVYGKIGPVGHLVHASEIVPA